MKRYLVSINELQTGMLLGENIYNNHGVLLIKDETVISEKIINVLKKFKKDEKLYIKVNESKNKNLEILKLKKKKNVIIPNSKYRDKDEIRANFKRVSSFIKETFEDLRVNKNSQAFIGNIKTAVLDIKENIKLNVEVFNELITNNNFDDYLYRHSVNVAVLSHFIGQWLSLDDNKLQRLIMAGLLHDIGKCRIDDSILNKPSKLNFEEFEEIKKHSMYSYFILIGLGYEDLEVLQAVSLHHEKEDGSGYPFGLKGTEIPIFAKILTVADIFDAMTSNRAYKKKDLPFKVIEMFQKEAFGKLDPKVVMTFVNKFSQYYLGTEVILNTGEVGRIIRLNHYDITKPLVITDSKIYIDISIERHINIIDFYRHNPLQSS